MGAIVSDIHLHGVESCPRKYRPPESGETMSRYICICMSMFMCVPEIQYILQTFENSNTKLRQSSTILF